MRVFFLSEIPCALSVAGSHVGLVDGFERSVELDPSDELYCSLAPVGEYLPVGFVFNEKFLFDPPPQVKLYHAREFVAVYVCNFLHSDPSLRVIRQERIGSALLTLVRQGKLQLYFDFGTVKIIDLPELLSDGVFEKTSEGFLLRGSRGFALISAEGELLLCQEGTVISTEGCLKAEISFHDSMGHTAICEWTEGKLTACSIRSANPPQENTFALAFFECVLIGADPAQFLTEELSSRAGVLKEYLGDFCSVVLTAEREKVGLVYERKPRVYDVRYFRIQLKDKKICNILPIE